MTNAHASRSLRAYSVATPSAHGPDEYLQDDTLQDLSRLVAPSILDAVSDLVCVCVNGKIKHINKAGIQFLGSTDANTLIGQAFQTFIGDDFAATIDDIIDLLANEPEPTPMRIKGLNGKLVSLRLKVVRLPELGETAHMILGENITRQAELTDAIQLSEARFRNLLNNALDLICVMDNGRISYINSAGLKMLKAAHKDEVIGHHLAHFLHDNYKDILAGDIRELVAEEDLLIPVRFVDLSHNQIDAEIGITILDSGRGQRYMIEARDITAHNRAVTALRQSIENLENRVKERTHALQEEVIERRRAEETLRHVASHDGLTDLPNRALMMDRLERAIFHAKRNQNKCAVLFLDLDGFKAINDTLGHDCGDHVLRETATRLTACIREDDTAARFGGDEFILVMSELNAADDVMPIARKILTAVSQPIETQGHMANVGVSIGIAFYPDHGDTPEGIIKAADKAMYDVKEGGKNNIAIATRPSSDPGRP